MAARARHLLLNARANCLANHRLDAACGRLTHDEWIAPRTGFFPSLAATMNHILIVDWYDLDALREEGRGVAVFDDEMPCDTMTALADAQRRADEALIAFCASRPDDAALGARWRSIAQPGPPARSHRPHARSPVHAPDPSSRAGPRDAVRHVGEAAAARRVPDAD